MRTIRRGEGFKIPADAKGNGVVDSALHVGDEGLVAVQREGVLDGGGGDGAAVDDAEVSGVVAEAAREAVRRVFDVVEGRADVGEGAVDHAAAGGADGDGACRVAVGAEAGERVRGEDGRAGERGGRVERPVPVYEAGERVVAVLPEGEVVEVKELAVPGEEGGGVVRVVADAGVDEGEVGVEGCGGGGGEGGGEAQEAADRGYVVGAVGGGKGVPGEAEGWGGRGRGGDGWLGLVGS